MWGSFTLMNTIVRERDLVTWVGYSGERQRFIALRWGKSEHERKRRWTTSLKMVANSSKTHCDSNCNRTHRVHSRNFYSFTFVDTERISFCLVFSQVETIRNWYVRVLRMWFYVRLHYHHSTACYSVLVYIWMYEKIYSNIASRRFVQLALVD